MARSLNDEIIDIVLIGPAEYGVYVKSFRSGVWIRASDKTASVINIDSRNETCPESTGFQQLVDIKTGGCLSVRSCDSDYPEPVADPAEKKVGGKSIQ